MIYFSDFGPGGGGGPAGVTDTVAINFAQANPETDAKRANCEIIANFDDDPSAVGWFLAGGGE